MMQSSTGLLTVIALNPLLIAIFSMVAAVNIKGEIIKQEVIKNPLIPLSKIC
jgi:hypothetical protein